ncbi:hypothetical protein HJG60_009975 [Phyllostomus discolor]|uniref:Uncharacterized protein n=1 Tax=Phyllostomus discolor TaxID=89673 RepID=A0A834B324_9CHIR|nr:hypothetical protein HJG60_009975 [Phyllostomus discolor]
MKDAQDRRKSPPRLPSCSPFPPSVPPFSLPFPLSSHCPSRALVSLFKGYSSVGAKSGVHACRFIHLKGAIEKATQRHSHCLRVAFAGKAATGGGAETFGGALNLRVVRQRTNKSLYGCVSVCEIYI